MELKEMHFLADFILKVGEACNVFTTNANEFLKQVYEKYSEQGVLLVDETPEGSLKRIEKAIFEGLYSFRKKLEELKFFTLKKKKKKKNFLNTPDYRHVI